MLTDENRMLRQELTEARATIRQMQAATHARYGEWQRLVALHRERQIALALQAEP